MTEETKGSTHIHGDVSSTMMTSHHPLNKEIEGKKLNPEKFVSNKGQQRKSNPQQKSPDLRSEVFLNGFPRRAKAELSSGECS